MRSLALLGALLAAGPTPAFALIQLVSSNVDYQNISNQGLTGSANVDSMGGVTQVSSLQQSIRYKIEDWLKVLTLSGGVTTIQPDYSSYLITSHDGAQVPLSTLTGNRNEVSSAASLAWASGSHNATIGWSGNVSEAPFAQQSITASYLETFFNKTTGLGVRGTVSRLNQPQSYYIDSNFVTQARPTLVHATDVAVTADQVLTERWKTSLQLSTGTREEDRPRNVGASAAQAYALSDRMFTQLALTRIQELTGEALKDDRGYFTLSSAELTLTVEPVIDLLVSASYAVVLEDESDPRSGRKVELGSDQVGAGLKWRRDVWGFELKAGYRVSNTAIHDLNLGGGISWQI